MPFGRARLVLDRLQFVFKLKSFPGLFRADRIFVLGRVQAGYRV